MTKLLALVVLMGSSAGWASGIEPGQWLGGKSPKCHHILEFVGNDGEKVMKVFGSSVEIMTYQSGLFDGGLKGKIGKLCSRVNKHEGEVQPCGKNDKWNSCVDDEFVYKEITTDCPPFCVKTQANMEYAHDDGIIAPYAPGTYNPCQYGACDESGQAYIPIKGKK